MEDTGLEGIRAARRELDEVITEIRTVPGYEHFLAAPTFEDVANAAREQPLVYLAAADAGGLGLVVRAPATLLPMASLEAQAATAGFTESAEVLPGPAATAGNGRIGISGSPTTVMSKVSRRGRPSPTSGSDGDSVR